MKCSLDVVGWNPDAEGILITAIDWEQGLRWMGMHPEKLSCLGPLLAGCVVDYEQLTFRVIHF